MWSNVCFISSLFSTNWNSVTHSLFILPLLSRLCKCTTATFQLFSFPQVVLPRHFHFQTSPLCLCHTTTFTFYFCTGWGGVTLRGNCQIWREPQCSNQHECEWFEDVNLKNANGPTFWSVVRLGLLLHCLILLMGCKDCKLSFMSPLHMPTVTGQHPIIVLLGFQMAFERTQLEENVSGATQMKWSIQLLPLQESMYSIIIPWRLNILCYILSYQRAPFLSKEWEARNHHPLTT